MVSPLDIVPDEKRGLLWRGLIPIFFTLEIRQYITHVNYTNPVNLEDNPLSYREKKFTGTIESVFNSTSEKTVAGRCAQSQDGWWGLTSKT